MTDTYHIQISVYVKVDTKYGAKAAANIAKRSLELMTFPANALDEVIIDSVGIEASNIPADMRTAKFCGNCNHTHTPGDCPESTEIAQ